MGTLSLTLPTIGQPNSTEDVKIPNALTAIQSEYNANIPNILGAYKPLFQGSTTATAGLTAGTYYITTSGLVASGTATANPIQSVFYIDPAALAISGYSTKIRVVCVVNTNGTAPGMNFIMGVHPVTASAGAANSVSITLGAATIAATVFVPALSTLGQGTSIDVAMPAATQLACGVVTSGTIAANASVVLGWQIQYRYV